MSHPFAPILLLALAAPLAAEDAVLPSAAARFASREAADVPDFRRHVQPLLGRLGCNGRSCHGSFQGQGGFRLSLFGGDFDADHRALLDGRIDRNDPATSLVLRKPTLDEPHEGGERFERGDWRYELLRRWIAGGARPAANGASLERLEVQPAELSFGSPGEATALRAVAHWSDGSREDVTPLVRTSIEDDTVATIDDELRVTATGRGDTNLVLFYDAGVVAVPIVVPVTDLAGERYPDVPATTEIDRRVVDKLRTLGVVPSEICTDAEFLRRASIDLTGTLPTPDEVVAFLDDRDPAKRERKVDELLARPAHAAWWANKLCDFTGCNPNQQAELGQELAVRWYGWLYRRVADNVPYDEIVAGLVLAEGRAPGESYEEYAARTSAYFRDESPADFAERETMPFFWSRRTLEQPRDKALAFAHAFLGTRLECAECHQHPFDRWSQADFREVASLFGGLTYGVAPESREAYRRVAESVGAKGDLNKGFAVRDDLLARASAGETIPWRELHWNGGGPGARRFLGESLRVDEANGDPRPALMEWLRRPDNPWFARVYVNRVWANYFHRGLVDPTDDLNPANPPVNGPLLDHLARMFVASGYDMRRLHRAIVLSDAYQRGWRPNETNADDRRHFSRAIPRRLPAEVVYDALKQVTAASSELDTVIGDLDRRAIGHLSMRMAGTYAMRVFGKPERATNCDCERNDDPSLLQAVFLQNDPLVRIRLAESGWLAEIADASPSEVSALVDEAYLRALGRRPDEAERNRAAEHVADAASLREGLADLLWALVNTREFVLNH